jgi:phosphate transport system permease protein
MSEIGRRPDGVPVDHTSASVTATRARLRRRHAAERRFKRYSIAAVGIAAGLLMLLVATVGSRAIEGFRQAFVSLPIALTESDVDPTGARDPEVLADVNFLAILKRSLRARFPEVSSRAELGELYAIASMIAPDRIRDAVLSGEVRVGDTTRVRFEVSDEIDAYAKGLVARDLPATDRKITDLQIRWVDALLADGSMAVGWTRSLFQNGDSREPEVAGLLAALVGTAMTLSVTLALAFPLGVLAAIYLEEFAPKNRWTLLVEVNINNLAAVPSVIFGLLGLAVLLNVFGMPRSSPLVGGVVLALMTLPTLIIASRASIAAVPPSIREAAMAVGASDVQVVLHHVVPLAMPGILTGAIIGMARALGETAPLLMIGMVAFIVDVPKHFIDAATVLPVQIFIWADSPEKGFVGRTAAATLVLLTFLVVMNASAVILRRRFEKRW